MVMIVKDIPNSRHVGWSGYPAMSAFDPKKTPKKRPQRSHILELPSH